MANPLHRIPVPNRLARRAGEGCCVGGREAREDLNSNCLGCFYFHCKCSFEAETSTGHARESGFRYWRENSAADIAPKIRVPIWTTMTCQTKNGKSGRARFAGECAGAWERRWKGGEEVSESERGWEARKKSEREAQGTGFSFVAVGIQVKLEQICWAPKICG